MPRKNHHSDAGKERNREGKARKSRAGQDSHASGNYVRAAVRPSQRPPQAPIEIEHAPPYERKPVSVPSLRFLERKKIAGEWL